MATDGKAKKRATVRIDDDDDDMVFAVDLRGARGNKKAASSGKSSPEARPRVNESVNSSIDRLLYEIDTSPSNRRYAHVEAATNISGVDTPPGSSPGGIQGGAGSDGSPVASGPTMPPLQLGALGVGQGGAGVKSAGASADDEDSPFFRAATAHAGDEFEDDEDGEGEGEDEYSYELTMTKTIDEPTEEQSMDGVARDAAPRSQTAIDIERNAAFSAAGHKLMRGIVNLKETILKHQLDATYVKRVAEIEDEFKEFLAAPAASVRVHGSWPMGGATPKMQQARTAQGRLEKELAATRRKLDDAVNTRKNLEAELIHVKVKELSRMKLTRMGVPAADADRSLAKRGGSVLSSTAGGAAKEGSKVDMSDITTVEQLLADEIEDWRLRVTREAEAVKRKYQRRLQGQKDAMTALTLQRDNLEKEVAAQLQEMARMRHESSRDEMRRVREEKRELLVKVQAMRAKLDAGGAQHRRLVDKIHLLQEERARDKEDYVRRERRMRFAYEKTERGRELIEGRKNAEAQAADLTQKLEAMTQTLASERANFAAQSAAAAEAHRELEKQRADEVEMATKVIADKEAQIRFVEASESSVRTQMKAAGDKATASAGELTARLEAETADKIIAQQDLASANSRIQMLEKELSEAATTRDQLVGAMELARAANEKRLKGEARATEDKLATETARVGELQTALDAAKAEVEKMRSEQAAAGDASSASRLEVEQLQKRALAAQNEAADAKNALADARRELAEVKVTSAAASQAATDATVKFRDEVVRSSMLEDELRRKREEISALKASGVGSTATSAAPAPSAADTEAMRKLEEELRQAKEATAKALAEKDNLAKANAQLVKGHMTDFGLDDTDHSGELAELRADKTRLEEERAQLLAQVNKARAEAQSATTLRQENDALKLAAGSTGATARLEQDLAKERTRREDLEREVKQLKQELAAGGESHIDALP